jgi:hypothetical protein
MTGHIYGPTQVGITCWPLAIRLECAHGFRGLQRGQGRGDPNEIERAPANWFDLTLASGNPRSEGQGEQKRQDHKEREG